MKTITLEVSDPVAEKIEKMSALEKKAISETLRQLVTNRRNLDEILEDIRSQAERNGLTPEVLDKILKEIGEETKWSVIVIFDCNVLLSAFISRGSTADKCWEKSKKSDVIVASQQTFDEFNSVFLRTKFDRYLILESRLELILEVQTLTKIIPVRHTVTICRDPKDNQYLELALSAKADCILLGDPDLLVLNPFENIPIIYQRNFRSV